LIRRFFLKNQEKNQKVFSKNRRQSGDFVKKSGETSEGFFKIRLHKRTADSFLLEKQNCHCYKLLWLVYQVSNGNNCLTSEIKESEVIMNVSKSWKWQSWDNKPRKSMSWHLSILLVIQSWIHRSDRWNSQKPVRKTLEKYRIDRARMT
jgi:hypothetical protein